MNLADALESAGLAHLQPAFDAEGIDLADIASLSNDDLAALGVARIGDRTRLRALASAASNGTAPATIDGSTRVGTTTPPQVTQPGPSIAHTAPGLSGGTRVVGTTNPVAQAGLDGRTRVAGTGATGGAPAAVGENAEALPERIGSYRILGQIGAGGMGSVLRARHVEEGWARRQGGDVAIKLVHPSLAADPSFRERFFVEASIGKRVSHPAMVMTHEVLAEGPWLGMVMQYVEGEPLTARFRTSGISLGELLPLIGPLSEALDHLHSLDIIHRDIKPANIIIRPDGSPVILDLGIAKDAGSGENHTKTATAMGTMAWMAPEQADAKHVDGAADRYALGLIAYALLSGRMPWGNQTSEYRAIAMKLGGQLEALANITAVDAHVADAVMRMLALEPGDRFPTCVDFVAALRGDTPSAAKRKRTSSAATKATKATERSASDAKRSAGPDTDAETRPTFVQARATSPSMPLADAPMTQTAPVVTTPAASHVTPTYAASAPSAEPDVPAASIDVGSAILWMLCCMPVGFAQWGQGAKGWVWVVLSYVTGGLGGVVAVIDYWMCFNAQRKRPLGKWEFFPRA